MVGITRSNGVNSTLTYDAASRLTGIRDGKAGSSPAIEIQATMNAAGRVSAMRMAAPLDPAPLLKPQTMSFPLTRPPRSTVPVTGTTTGAGWSRTENRTYTWDGASRLTGTGEATLTYNSFGDLRTRTAGARTIRYFGNKSLGMNPIVAEQDTASLRFIEILRLDSRWEIALHDRCL